jgi:hypothetical protein
MCFCRKPLLRSVQILSLLLGLGIFAPKAQASVEPVAPGYVEYTFLTNNWTWFDISAPITVGAYVDDLLSDNRLNQPAGRGRLGIVTEIGWDPAPYNQYAALVDFGNGYTAGIVFSELSAIQVVPEPASLSLIAAGTLFWRTAARRRR